MANCSSHEEAARFHGVFTGLGESESDTFYRKLIEYMMNSNRSRPSEIARNITMIESSVNTLNLHQILDEYRNVNPLRADQIRTFLDYYSNNDPSNISTQSIDEENTNDINELIGMHYSEFDRVHSISLLT